MIGGEEGGGGHLAVPHIVCVLPLYCLCILLRMAQQSPTSGSRENEGGRQD